MLEHLMKQACRKSSFLSNMVVDFIKEYRDGKYRMVQIKSADFDTFLSQKISPHKNPLAANDEFILGTQPLN